MLDSNGHPSAVVYEQADSGETSHVRSTDWWIEGELRRLNSELARTRTELEILRSTTAQVLTAILSALQPQAAPVAEVPSEIRDLADLGEPLLEGPSEGPITGEIEAIDLTNQESLDRLDRRFRWGRGPRKST